MGKIVEFHSLAAVDPANDIEVPRHRHYARGAFYLVRRLVVRPLIKIIHYLVFALLAMFSPIAQIVFGGYAILAMLGFIFVMATGIYHQIPTGLVWGLPISSIIAFSLGLGWALIVEWLGFTLVD